MIPSIRKITQPQRKMLIHISIGVSVFFFIGGIALLSYLAHQENKLSDTLYPNIYINNIDVGKKTQKEALRAITVDGKNLSDLQIEAIYKKSPIATISAEDMDIKWNGEEVVEEAFSVGRGADFPSGLQEKVISLLGLKRQDYTTAYIYNRDQTNEYISSISTQYNRKPKNALFEIEDDRVTAFREDEKGKRLNVDAFLSEVDAIVEKINTDTYEPKKEKVTVQEEILDAEITLANTNNLGIEELVAEGVSDYTGSIPSRVHNLTLATSKFHGVIVPQGETLSFNEIIGDISINTGYQQAYIIKNGKTVLGDGGGVCQVSTTLFRTGLNAGLPITERHAHAYRVSYYENDSQPGFDATIYSPVVDLKMENNTPANILIQTEIDEEMNLLYIRFYGKKDDREIQISEAEVYDVAPAPPAIHQDDPTLPRGQVKQVDYAAPGAKARFDYTVTRGEEVIQETEFFSSYKPWAAVYMVGTKD